MHTTTKKHSGETDNTKEKIVPKQPVSPQPIAVNPRWQQLASGLSNLPHAQRKCADCENQHIPIQTKLSVGPANDKYEQEADEVADKIVASGAMSASQSVMQTAKIQPIQRLVIQRQESESPAPAQSEEKDQSGEVLSEGASIAYDNLKLNPAFEAWKKQQTEALKYKLWDSQPTSYKAGLISFGALSLTGLGVGVAADPQLRADGIDFLQDKNVLMPLSLVPYSEYFPVSSFEYTLPSAEGSEYTFKTEFEFDPWLDLMSKQWGTPKAGLSLGVGSSYGEQGGFSALNSGNIKLTFGGGIVNLSGFVNDTLPVTPMLISDPATGEQPMWLMRSLPGQLSDSLPKGTGVFITVDVQRLPELLGLTKPDPKASVQRKEANNAGHANVPNTVNNVLAGAGKPLEKATRDFMEPRFGQDFSDVRVHTDPQAAESAKSINARAYTSGRDIVFAAGQCDPDSAKGKHLLAHELTHVVQQAGTSQGIQRKGPEEDEEAKKVAQKTKIDKAKKTIKDGFGVSAAVDGDKDWTEAELTTLHAALSMLPAADKATLKGIIISRVASLGTNIAGRFSYSVTPSVSSNSFTHEAKMELADSAYSGTNDEAKRTIVHEVGHAIAGEKLQDANVSHAEAVVDYNRKAEATSVSFERLTASNEILDPAVKALNDKIAEADAESDPAKKALLIKEIPALRVDYTAKKKASQAPVKANADALAAEKKASEKTTAKQAIVDSHKITSTDLATIKQAAETANTSHSGILQTAKTNASKIEQSNDKVKRYHDAVLALSSELESFDKQTKDQNILEEDVEVLVAAVVSQIKNRDSAKIALGGDKNGKDIIANFVALETAQENYFEAIKKHSLAHNRSKIVQGFSTYVETHNIAPITSYALENWPHKPEEFYAEAYSYWVTGKFKGQTGNLQVQYDLLQKWFDDGKHR